MADLEKFQNDVESFLKKEEFNIFQYQSANFSKFLSELEWHNTENWEEFFSIAKKEGIVTIFEEIRQFSQKKFESFKESLEDDEEDGFEFKDLVDNICANLESNLDEIYSVSFSWIKNNIRHTITNQVEWMKEIKQEIQELKRKQLLQKKKLVQELQEQRRPSWEEEMTAEVPTDLDNKDPNDLAKELLEFIEVNYPDASRHDLWQIHSEFWESKGLNNRSNKHRNFSNKIQSIADKIIDKNEREKLPELIEKCVEWALENKIDKPTQAILRGFLAEDNVNLSPNNFKILHTKVLLELKASK